MPAGSPRARLVVRGLAILSILAVVMLSAIGTAGTPARADTVAGVVSNSSFETPSTGGYVYRPSGTAWTFTGYAGVQHNGSAYSGSTVAPNGTQTAFLQGAGGTLGAMSQSVALTAGTYTIGFQAARRSGSIQPIRVSVDGVAVGTYSPTNSTFSAVTTPTFVVAAGSHALRFAATDSVGDNTTFVDAVTLSTAAGKSGGEGTIAPTTPTAPAGLMAAAGSAQVVLSWTASTGASTYSVYRGTTTGGESTTAVATGVTGLTATITGLTDGTPYFFTVRVHCQGGELCGDVWELQRGDEHPLRTVELGRRSWGAGECEL